MRASLTATLLLLAPFARGEEECCQHETVRCGKDTVVVYADTQSPDARYALGWTIRPLVKDANPVDWAKFEKEGEFDGCVFEQNETAEIKATHDILDGVIDLRNKSFKPIPDTDPIGPFSNHRDISVKWIDEQRALILVDQRFCTGDAFFVSPASEPLMVASMLPQMDEMVEKLIREKRPLAPETSMCICFGLEEDVATKTSEGTVLDRVPCKVENGILHARFWASIPKGSFEDIEGHLLISLQNGKPLKAVSAEPADQPFVGELGQADERLNQVYRSLRRASKDNDLNQLVNDQKEWISTRNSEAREFANEKARFFDEGANFADYRAARNQKALELTTERVDILQKQLAAATRN